MTDSPDARGRTARKPSEISGGGFKDVALRVKDEVGNDHVMLAAAGVAFFGFLAIIPALAALVSILGLITSPEDAAERAEDLFAQLPQEARDLLTRQLENISGRAASTLSVSLAVSLGLALWSASSGMGHLISAVNLAYDEHDRRNWFHRKAMALLFTVCAIVFFIFAAGGLAALPAILDAANLPSWLQIVYWPLLLVGFALGLSVLYRYAPYRDEPEWQWVSWGSVIAVVLWLVAAVGFRIYAANFASYDESYGSLAAVVVLMLWLLITAFVVLLGAEINAELEHQTVLDSTEGPDQPMGSRHAVMADTVGESSAARDRIDGRDREHRDDGEWIGRDRQRSGARDGEARDPDVAVPGTGSASHDEHDGDAHTRDARDGEGLAPPRVDERTGRQRR